MFGFYAEDEFRISIWTFHKHKLLSPAESVVRALWRDCFEPTFIIFFWIEEYCQTSPNKNKSPKIWRLTSILVCCIFGERSQQFLCFFKLFLQVSQFIKIKITIIQIQIGSQKPTGKELNLRIMIIYLISQNLEFLIRDHP